MTESSQYTKKELLEKLTPKQAKFANLYVELSNATEAYKKVYSWQRMKPETVNRKAIEVLQNGNVAAMIQKIREKLEDKEIISKEEIIEDLKEISSVTIEDYIESVDLENKTINWKDPKVWTKPMKRACTGIKPTAHGIELTVYGVEYAYNRIAKMMGYDAPVKQDLTVNSTLADLLKS